MARPLHLLASLAESKSVYAIVLDDAKARKVLHEFLETIPGMAHKSLFCPGGVSEEKFIRLIKCQYCYDYINLDGGDYHYGSMENHQDDYFNKTCSKCGNIRSFEPGYDFDLIKHVSENNVVVFSTQFPTFRRTTPWKKVPRSLSEIVDILKNKQLHEVPPFKLPFRRRMQAIIKHVTATLLEQ